MLFTISLIEWYYWYSDIKDTLLHFEHVELEDVPRMVNKCAQSNEYKNRCQTKKYMSILIEPEVD